MHFIVRSICSQSSCMRAQPSTCTTIIAIIRLHKKPSVYQVNLPPPRWIVDHVPPQVAKAPQSLTSSRKAFRNLTIAGQSSNRLIMRENETVNFRTVSGRCRCSYRSLTLKIPLRAEQDNYRTNARVPCLVYLPADP